MIRDITGKKELASLKFDWKIYQLNAASTKCCAGGTRDVTGRHGGQKGKFLMPISMKHDEKDAKGISSAYGYLRH
jgi:hypothetical protein